MRTQGLVSRIDRFNAAHPWSHNEWYHRWILRGLPSTISTALDVGCGTGDLVRALADRAGHVEGIDTDPWAIEQARAASPASDRISFSVASVLDLSDRQRYDAITAVAVLHHMPFADALRRLVAALAPGGTLIIVGCYAAESLTDRALSVAAVPANMAVGLYTSRGRQVARPPSMSARTAAPTETLSAIRAEASDQLSGFSLRRGLFWRYLLRYTAPLE